MNGVKVKGLKLTKEMIEQLERRNFPFNYIPKEQNENDDFWKKMIELSVFKKSQGHMNVPDGHMLKPWVNQIRSKHREGNLAQDQVDVLLSMDFPMMEFLAGFTHYCKCKRKQMFDNTCLEWCESVRQQYHHNNLSSEHEDLLTMSNFDFNMNENEKAANRDTGMTQNIYFYCC